jgi:hypothetical protein
MSDMTTANNKNFFFEPTVLVSIATWYLCPAFQQRERELFYRDPHSYFTVYALKNHSSVLELGRAKFSFIGQYGAWKSCQIERTKKLKVR